jgi:hypothetical protein
MPLMHEPPLKPRGFAIRIHHRHIDGVCLEIDLRVWARASTFAVALTKNDQEAVLESAGHEEDAGTVGVKRGEPAGSPQSQGRQKFSWALIFTYRGWRTEFGRSHVWVVGEKAWL